MYLRNERCFSSVKKCNRESINCTLYQCTLKQGQSIQYMLWCVYCIWSHLSLISEEDFVTNLRTKQRLKLIRLWFGMQLLIVQQYLHRWDYLPNILQVMLFVETMWRHVWWNFKTRAHPLLAVGQMLLKNVTIIHNGVVCSIESNIIMQNALSLIRFILTIKRQQNHMGNIVDVWVSMRAEE